MQRIHGALTRLPATVAVVPSVHPGRKYARTQREEAGWPNLIAQNQRQVGPDKNQVIILRETHSAKNEVGCGSR